MKLNSMFNVFVALAAIALAKLLSATPDHNRHFDGETSGDGEPMCDAYQCIKDSKCIPHAWICDGEYDCEDLSDEAGCERRGITIPTYRNQIQNSSEIDGVSGARKKLTEWILQHRISGYGTNKWSLQVPRIANALYFEDWKFFQVGNQTGEELRYEITIQALRKLSEMEKFSTPELALYVNAMLVACMNPRDFHGFDLVAELRRRVDAKTFTNPMEIFVLCIAGDTMTSGDVDRVNILHETKNHPSWRDTRAIAVLTMSCIRHHSNVASHVTKPFMIPELMQAQATNGSVGNVKTTALVLQALIASKVLKVKDFDFEAAVRSILRSQYADGSFGSLLNSYYVLPVLNHKSLMDISVDHCRRTHRTEKQMIYDSWLKKERKLQIRLSVVDGKETDVKKAWSLKAPVNSSFYEIMEVVSLMDPKLKIDYNIFDDKPFVSSVFGIENDPELGLYWFTYMKNSNSSVESRVVKQSPVDVTVTNSQELKLWYKEGSWRDVESHTINSRS